MSSHNHTVNNFHGGGQSELNHWSQEGGLSKKCALKPAPESPRYRAQQQSPSPQEHRHREKGLMSLGHAVTDTALETHGE